ncbi:uncharacterized protein LOC121323383 [Polyodon spathula]|uniref:uncharacterized protein LOC121323383 n=1 Tax=Polyodon spathula TaxID=7913 RepID=UPI001B7EB04D|nr:uncharacterized protein LOC121323383 [Polyodon spathula]
MKYNVDISEGGKSSTDLKMYTTIYNNITSMFYLAFNGTSGYRETTVLQIRGNNARNMYSVRESTAVSVEFVNIFSMESDVNKSEVDKKIGVYLEANGIQGYTSKNNCDYFNCDSTTSTCKEDVTPNCHCRDGYYKIDLLDKSCITSTDFEMITIIVGVVSAVIILGLAGGLIAVAIRRKGSEDNKDDYEDTVLVAKKPSAMFGLQNPAMANSHVTIPFAFPKVQAASGWNQSSQVKRNGLDPGPPSNPRLGNGYDDDQEEEDDVHVSRNKGRIGNRSQTNPYNNPYSTGPVKQTYQTKTNGMKYGSPAVPKMDYDDDDDYHYRDMRGSYGMQMKPYNNAAPRATLDYSYPGSRKY